MMAEAGAPTRRIDRLLADYDRHHASPVNRVLQCLAVPLICWAVLAFLASLPLPVRIVPGLDLAGIAAVLLVIGILVLSRPLAISAAAVVVLLLLIAAAYRAWGSLPLWQMAIVVLAGGWLLRFIGYAFEAQRPTVARQLLYVPIGLARMLAWLHGLIGVRH